MNTTIEYFDGLLNEIDVMMESIYHEEDRVEHRVSFNDQLALVLVNNQFHELRQELSNIIEHTYRMQSAYNARIRAQYLEDVRTRTQQRVQLETRLQDPQQEPNRLPGLWCLPKPKIKTIRHSEITALVHDDCGICLERKPQIECIRTSCGHDFCKTCYESLVTATLTNPIRKNRVIKCPMCRTENPKYTEFRERKVPTRRPAVIFNDR